MVQKFIVIVVFFYFTNFAYSFESAALKAELLKCLGSFKYVKELTIKDKMLEDIDNLINKAYTKAKFVGYLHPYDEEYYYVGLENIRYIYSKKNYSRIIAIITGCKETLKMIHD